MTFVENLIEDGLLVFAASSGTFALIFVTFLGHICSLMGQDVYSNYKMIPFLLAVSPILS